MSIQTGLQNRIGIINPILAPFHFEQNDPFLSKKNNKIQAVSLASDNDFKMTSDDKNRESQDSNNDKNEGKLSQGLIGGEIDMLIQ